MYYHSFYSLSTLYSSLSSVRYLGFEVDTGHDPNDSSLSTTTMVTFQPRYIIENLTKYQLNVTQRYCLKTVNNLPGEFIEYFSPLSNKIMKIG